MAVVMVVGLTLLTVTPAVATSYPDVTGTSVLSPAQVQAKQWWILRLNLRKAWKITRGQGATVAVIDTGVDRKFADLRGALAPGFGVDTHATGDTDKTYHGTRVADDIAGRGTGFGLLGVAPRARILPVTVPSSAGPDADAAALNRLATMTDPPQVINMSFGGPFPCPGGVAAATRKAARAGIVLIAGAGNSGQLGNQSEYPANCPGVVAVGAVNSKATVWSQSEKRSYVMLTGPGVHIVGYDAQAKSGYGYADGTSDASAMVSGIAALIRAHSPTMSARDVVTRLLATSRQFIGKQGTRNNRYGYGVALPYNALTHHVAANAPNPVYAALGSGSPSTGAGSSAPSTSPATGSPTSSSAPTTAGPTSASRTGTSAASGSGSGGTSVGLVIVIVVVVIAVVGIVIAVTLRGRRRAVNGPPPYGPGPPGGRP